MITLHGNSYIWLWILLKLIEGLGISYKRRISACVHVNEKRPGQVFTFEPVTEDVLQNGHKVDELWRRVIYRLGTAAVQQSLDRKPEHMKVNSKL